ncbi:MAG: ABC transporter ATP-binding protein [Candidatus Hadarchaeum sp.]
MRDVEFRFGPVRALRDVTVTVPKGSLCGLVGPNAAGKTTLMRILVTDLVPTEGEVEVLGCQLPRDAQRLRPRVGFMPDSAGLYEELTLSEYLDYFAAFYGLNRLKRATSVEIAMELAGVTKLANRRLLGLSKGEKQRVLLARALLHDPELLVLDEPAEGLDPRARVELRELLVLLRERGKTILISSHILSDLEEVCSHLIFIDRGKILYQGSRERLLRDRLQCCTIRIEALDPVDGLAGRLASDLEILIESRDERTLEVAVPENPAFAYELLRHLIADGYRICSFARSTDSLEAIYLRLTEDQKLEA